MLIALSLTILQGWSWYSIQEVRMSRPPPFVPQSLPLTPRESRIGVRAHIAFDDIRAVVETATAKPRTGEQSGETCRDVVGANLCISWQARYAVQRVASVGVTQHGDRVRLILPLALSGHVDLHGTLAALLGLSVREFEGTFDALVDIALDVNAAWCPVVAAAVEVIWHARPRLELRAEETVDLGEQIEAPLREALGALQEQIRQALSCELIRAQVARLWHPHTFPLGAIVGKNELHANLVPTGLALSRVAAETDRLAVTARLTARAEIADLPVTATVLPLPALTQALPEQGTVALSLRVHLPYEQLRRAAEQAFSGKIFQMEVVPGHRFTLKVTSADVYPSGEQVIVALGFLSEIGLPILDGSGTLYLSGRPRIVGRTSFDLAGFRLSRVVDNPLWRIVSVIWEDEILDTVRTLTKFDLKAEADDAARLAAAALMRHAKANDLELHIDPPHVTLRGLSTAEHDLTAEIEIRSAADLRLGGSLLRAP